MQGGRAEAGIGNYNRYVLITKREIILRISILNEFVSNKQSVWRKIMKKEHGGDPTGII